MDTPWGIWGVIDIWRGKRVRSVDIDYTGQKTSQVKKTAWQCGLWDFFVCLFDFHSYMPVFAQLSFLWWLLIMSGHFLHKSGHSTSGMVERFLTPKSVFWATTSGVLPPPILPPKIDPNKSINGNPKGGIKFSIKEFSNHTKSIFFKIEVHGIRKPSKGRK